MAADRQQRRQRRRELLRRGEAVLKRGLSLRPTKDDVVGLALLLADILADTRQASRASAAAETMLKALEASVKAEPGRLELACRKGCSYCCHGWVSATAPELLLIGRTIAGARAGDPTRGRQAVIGRAHQTAGLGIGERVGRKLPCPLLSDNLCSVYAVRPVVCRQTTSLDLSACIAEFEGHDRDVDVRVSRVYLDHARNCRIPLQAALAALGLSHRAYELSAGLTVALDDNAELRWLAGDDPFSGIAEAPADPPPLAQAVATITDAVRALG